MVFFTIIKWALSTIFGFLVNAAKYLLSCISYYLRPLNKWFLRKTTNSCELMRIVYETLDGFTRTQKVEESMSRTKNPRIRDVVAKIHQASRDESKIHYEGSTVNETRSSLRRKLFTQTVKLIAEEKQVNTTLHQRFVVGLGNSVLSIYAVSLLKSLTDKRRLDQFVVGDQAHEDKLRYIWSKLMDESLDETISKKWSDLGFQHVHPATDLRGTGMLAIDCLIYLTSQYKDNARQLLNISRHPLYGYPFGLVSIHMTFLAFQLLQSESAKTHFYNMYEKYQSWHEDSKEVLLTQIPKDELEICGYVIRDKVMTVYFDLYIALLFKFNSHWFNAKPKSIMEYGSVKLKFEEIIQNSLRDPNCKIHHVFINV